VLDAVLATQREAKLRKPRRWAMWLVASTAVAAMGAVGVFGVAVRLEAPSAVSADLPAPPAEIVRAQLALVERKAPDGRALEKKMRSYRGLVLEALAKGSER
jgi:hypothetical protein